MKLKKIAALSLTTALALTMVACGGSGTNSNGATSSDSKGGLGTAVSNLLDPTTVYKKGETVNGKGYTLVIDSVDFLTSKTLLIKRNGLMPLIHSMCSLTTTPIDLPVSSIPRLTTWKI